MIYFLVIFLVLSILFRKNRMLLLLFGLQVVSAACALFIDKQIQLETATDYLALIYIIVCNILLIIPWKKANGTVTVTTSFIKVNQLFKILVPILSIVFIIYVIAAYVSMTHFGADIRAEEGAYSKFLYNSLPFPAQIFMLATIIYPYSYFMIPMAFYYAQYGDTKKMRVCFFFSLIVLLHGLTIFTRWTVALYLLLFLSTYLFFYKTIPQRTSKRIKGGLMVLGGLFVALLVFLTLTRFAESTYGLYSASDKSLAKDPVTYGVCDYLGQGNAYGHDLLVSYDGQTMHGMFAAEGLSHILSYAGIHLVDERVMQERRDKLLGWYYDKFFCVPVYWVYDFGFIIGSMLILLYYIYIRKKVKGRMSFNDLCLLSIWSQIPLMAIFYSSLFLCVELLFLYIPIYLFMKVSRVNMKKDVVFDQHKMQAIEK